MKSVSRFNNLYFALLNLFCTVNRSIAIRNTLRLKLFKSPRSAITHHLCLIQCLCIN